MFVESHDWIDITLRIWFSLTAVSVIYVAWDLITRTPEMKVIKMGLGSGHAIPRTSWFRRVLALLSRPAPATHEEFIALLWKQSIGSTIHCIAGDATGIIVAATTTQPAWVADGP